MNRLGIRFDLRAASSESAGVAAAPTTRYAEILAHAAAAEGCGADVLWVAERPFVPGALLPAALPLCAALAECTGRARIATGAVPLPLHHPLRIAEDTATVDILSGGRFELGVGLGEHAEGFDGFGVPIRERAGRFEEALELVLRAWSGETVGGSGGHFEIAEVTVHPQPLQRPHPPVWIAAQADAALRRAARLGTGLLTDSLEAARRFLEAWCELDHEAADARIAWHVEPGSESVIALADRVRASVLTLAPARVDVVVPAFPSGVSSSEALERLASLASALRPSFAG